MTIHVTVLEAFVAGYLTCCVCLFIILLFFSGASR